MSPSSDVFCVNLNTVIQKFVKFPILREEYILWQAHCDLKNRLMRQNAVEDPYTFCKSLPKWLTIIPTVVGSLRKVFVEAFPTFHVSCCSFDQCKEIPCFLHLPKIPPRTRSIQIPMRASYNVTGISPYQPIPHSYIPTKLSLATWLLACY